MSNEAYEITKHIEETSTEVLERVNSGECPSCRKRKLTKDQYVKLGRCPNFVKKMVNGFNFFERKNMKKKGFTIIELLTVIAIITVLIGLLVPSLRKVRRIALDLTQRSQFHSIDIGLEMWAYENDDEYPESSVEYGASYDTLGAQKLAEALIGRDLHGFDDLSTWNADDDNLAIAPNRPYDSLNYANRENLYLDVDRVNAFQIAQIYGFALGGIYPGDYDRLALSTGLMPAPVLTDVYKRVKITTPDIRNIKIGSPILYFKAKNTDIFVSTMVDSSIYNYNDNWRIFNLGRSDDGEPHPYDWTNPVGVGGTGNPDFYDDLVNPSIPSGIYSVPYHKDSYVLLSAGADGLYGTADDVWNIKNKKK